MYPMITIQCDWNDVLRSSKSQAWISTKFLNQNSTHGKIISEVNPPDGKLKIEISEEYQFLSYSTLSLVIKHLGTGLKVAFIAPTHAHKVHKKGVLSVSVAENSLAVSSCEADHLLVWDCRTSEVLLTLTGHGGPVYRCRFFPSGVVLLSAGADGSCRIWSAETGVNPVLLKGHLMAVTDIAIIDRGRNVISVSRDGNAKLWDVGESTCLDNIVSGKGQINCCCIISSSQEHTVHNEREVGTTNKLLLIGCESGEVVCAHIAKRQILFSLQLESPCNCTTALNDTVLLGCADGKIVQIHSTSGEKLKEWHESASPVLSLFTISNTLAVSGRQDGTCTVFPISSQHQDTRVQLTGSDCDGIRDIACNGKWVFAACRDGLIRKYDINQISVHFK